MLPESVLSAWRFAAMARALHGRIATEAPMDEEIEECIERCTACRKACVAAVPGASSQGDSDLHELLMDCAEACAAAISFMRRESSHLAVYCGACSEIAERCADRCTAINVSELTECAVACQKCALSCNRLSAPSSTEMPLAPSA